MFAKPYLVENTPLKLLLAQSRSVAGCYALHTALFVMFCLIFYRALPGFLIQTHDGQNLYFLAENIFSWRSSRAETFTFNPLNGMGSTFWPINPTFIPFLWIFRLTEDPTLRVYFLSIAAAGVVFVASLAFFASLRLTPRLAIGAAWLAFVLLLLQTVDSMTGADTLIAISSIYVALAVLIETGRHDARLNWLWLGLFQVAFAVSVLAHPGWHIIGLPIFGSAVVVLLLWAENARDRNFKFLALALAIATHFLGGTYKSLYYVMNDSARTLLADNFLHYSQVPYLAGHLFRGSVTEIVWGILLIIGLCSGDLARLSSRPRLAQAVTILSTSIYSIAIVSALWFLYSGKLWVGPKPSYVLLSAYPLAALATSLGMRRIYMLAGTSAPNLWALVRQNKKRTVIFVLIGLYLAWHLCNLSGSWIPLIAVLGLTISGALFAVRLSGVAILLMLPLVVMALYHNVDGAFGGGADRRFNGVARMGLQRNPLIDYLVARTALKPETEFRGYVDDYYQLVPGMKDINGRVVADWYSNWVNYGNGQKLFAWNVHGIPTLSQYSPYIKPLYFSLFSRLLNETTDRHVVNYVAVTRPNIKMMALMGMRYLVSDIANLDLAGVRPVFAWNKFQVYELANPNLATYSPTQTVVLGTAQEILARLASNEFKPDAQALFLKAGPAGGLRGITNSTLTFERGGYQVTARSEGRSLIVIPVQFSHCFDKSVLSGDPNAQLIRVNLVQTGLLFEKEVRIKARLKYWPLRSAACQRLDFEDSQTLVQK